MRKNSFCIPWEFGDRSEIVDHKHADADQPNRMPMTRLSLCPHAIRTIASLRTLCSHVRSMISKIARAWQHVEANLEQMGVLRS